MSDMTMKRILVALIAAIYMAAPALAKTAKDFFIEDSTKVFPLLSKSLRMDMLDYYVSGQSVELENAFGGKSQLQKATNQYVSVRLSDAHSVEIWVPDTVAKKSVVVVNYQYRVPASDGNIVVYNLVDMSENIKAFDAPDITDFISVPKNSDMNKQEVADKIDIPMISYDINPDTGEITASHNLNEFLSQEEYARIEKYMIKSIRYVWTGKKYKRVK